MSEKRDSLQDDSKRRSQLASLRLAGVDFAMIVERLGYQSETEALADYQKLLAELAPRAMALEEAQQIELDRLDRLQAAVWASALRGEIPAVDAALRVIDRRIRLLGLDPRKSAPVKPPTVEDAEVGVVSDLTARIAGRRAQAQG
jgi:hypothetical protein